MGCLCNKHFDREVSIDSVLHLLSINKFVKIIKFYRLIPRINLRLVIIIAWTKIFY